MCSKISKYVILNIFFIQIFLLLLFGNIAKNIKLFKNNINLLVKWKAIEECHNLFAVRWL